MNNNTDEPVGKYISQIYRKGRALWVFFLFSDKLSILPFILEVTKCPSQTR